MNRVRKIARMWEESAREGSLKVLAANKADTAARKRKYCKKVEPRGVVQSKPTKVEFSGEDITEQVDTIVDFSSLNGEDGMLEVVEAIDVVKLITDGEVAGVSLDTESGPGVVAHIASVDGKPWSDPDSDPVADIVRIAQHYRDHPSPPPKSIASLEDLTNENLRRVAKACGLSGYSKANKTKLIEMIRTYMKENSNEQ